MDFSLLGFSLQHEKGRAASLRPARTPPTSSSGSHFRHFRERGCAVRQYLCMRVGRRTAGADP